MKAWGVGAAIVSAILVVMSAPAGAQHFSSDVNAYVWDLDKQYPTEAAWNADLTRARQGMTSINSMRGRSGRSARDLADVLDAVSKLRGTAARMARFALLSMEVDTSSDIALARHSAATGLEIEVESAVAWLDAEVRAIGHGKVQRWLASEPRLDVHRRRLHRIFRESQHLPPSGAEAAVATMERWPRTASDAATALLQMDAGWPTIAINGEQVTVNGDGYTSNRRSPDKARREAINTAYHAKLKDLEEPLGLLLTRRIEGEMAVGKLRGIPNSIDAAFVLEDGVDRSTWRIMIDVVGENRATLARAARVLQRVHGLDRMTFGDFYARRNAPPREILVPEAVEITTAALAPLGPQYRRDLLQRLTQPWMHLPPRPNKSGTVGVFWQAGGGHPYSLITYTNNPVGSIRFAQAAALMMWYADVPERYTPDRREEDLPILSNSIWYIGRLLHDEELLKRTTGRDQRIAQLVDSLYFLWTGYFQNVVSADFERGIVEAQERGKPLTGPRLSERYLGLLRSYYGHGTGGADVPDFYAQHWMTNGSIFFSHTQVVWAVALAAAGLWVEQIQAGNQLAINGIRLTQTAEGSQYSGDIFRAVGINTTGREMHEALIRRFNRTLDQLEKELAGPP